MTIDFLQNLAGLFVNDEKTVPDSRDHRRFRTLAERHEVLVRQIHRIEPDIEPASDERLEELKKQLLDLLVEAALLIVERRAAV